MTNRPTCQTSEVRNPLTSMDWDAMVATWIAGDSEASLCNVALWRELQVKPGTWDYIGQLEAVEYVECWGFCYG